jgi:hypothetical protein
MSTVLIVVLSLAAYVALVLGIAFTLARSAKDGDE